MVSDYVMFDKKKYLVWIYQVFVVDFLKCMHIEMYFKLSMFGMSFNIRGKLEERDVKYGVCRGKLCE